MINWKTRVNTQTTPAPPAICRYCSRNLYLVEWGGLTLCAEHLLMVQRERGQMDWRDKLREESITPAMVRHGSETFAEYRQRMKLDGMRINKLDREDVPF